MAPVINFDDVSEDEVPQRHHQSTEIIDNLFGKAVIGPNQFKALGVTVGDPIADDDPERATKLAANEKVAQTLVSQLRGAAARAELGVKASYDPIQENGRMRVRFQPTSKRAYTPPTPEKKAAMEAKRAERKSRKDALLAAGYTKAEVKGIDVGDEKAYAAALAAKAPAAPDETVQTPASKPGNRRR